MTAGVDVVSFGATKNGALFGEAVVVLNPDAVRAMKHVRKLSMQLASKMRFVSVQLEALLAGDLWLRNGFYTPTRWRNDWPRASVRWTAWRFSTRFRPTPYSPGCRTT